VDPSLITEGQTFARKHFFSVFFAHFVSLVILLSYTPVQTLLLKTGRSDPMHKSRRRYLSTMLHVKLWYEADIISPEGLAYRDIQRIGRIHARFQKICHYSESTQTSQLASCVKGSDRDSTEILDLIREDCKLCRNNCNNNNNEEVQVPSLDWVTATINPISQLDMIVTQFCFMGLIFLLPEKFGICPEDSRGKGMKGFVHLWALIGSLLGIDDEYNICLEKNFSRRKEILASVLIPEFLNSKPLETFRLWEALVSGVASYIIFIRLKAVLLFIIKDVLELQKGRLIKCKMYRSMTHYETVCYILMWICFSIGMKCTIFAAFLNTGLEFGIFLASWRFGVKV
jgi:hypothetical protein